ncbi:cytidylyltransferase domain-containing protein [Leifsonia poae]|uniref:cytidylyltransferase domain-containing protein n=1 Tax=Leifsonia poae TaxID=110933 RepID=UPI001CBAFC9E|nr:glycosyltransferase family protein [Leifsonia poae]
MTLAVLQARLSSTRLPGKVLAPVLGVPMILRQIERLRRSTTIDTLVVATSVEASDDPLANLLEKDGVLVRRGPLQDVAARFAAVVQEFRPSTLVRLTADCPLADHAVIDRVVEEHLASGADYTSNVIDRTYPDGLDVECIAVPAFERMLALPLTQPEREHVTLAIYSRPESFVLKSVEQSPSHAGLRWTVDLPADLEFVRAVYEHLYDRNPDFGQADILELVERTPGLNRSDADLDTGTN